MGNTLANFVVELQRTLQAELDPRHWAANVLSSLSEARRIDGDIVVIDKIVAGLTADASQGPSDPLALVSSLLLILAKLPGEPILLVKLIQYHLPHLLAGHGLPSILNNPQSLVRTIRRSLILLDEIDPQLAAEMVTDLVIEIKPRQLRSTNEARETDGPVKRATLDRTARRPGSIMGKTVLDMLIKAFDDAELRSRWPALAKLQ